MYVWKNRFKKTFKIRLIIIGLILGVAGWFLLGVMLFGRFFSEELLRIEQFLQTTAFIWSFRIIIIGATLVMLWKNKWLSKALQNIKFRISLFTFYGIGIIGWIWGIIDLLA
ncbi:hypothetical protein ACFLXF_04335 [Chloroflexota bacterium]